MEKIEWTTREDTFLLKNYDKLTKQEIGDKLGRTKKAVGERFRNLKRKHRESIVCNRDDCFGYDPSQKNNCSVVTEVYEVDCKFYKGK